MIDNNLVDVKKANLRHDEGFGLFLSNIELSRQIMIRFEDR